MFEQPFDNVTLMQSFSSYFVTIIPKVDSPLQLGDFHPISLPGLLYRLVEKVLAGRLAVVMGKIILSNQSTFIKGRHLVDEVVAVKQIIDHA